MCIWQGDAPRTASNLERGLPGAGKATAERFEYTRQNLSTARRGHGVAFQSLETANFAFLEKDAEHFYPAAVRYPFLPERLTWYICSSARRSKDCRSTPSIG